mmetsp:Transcript_47231/g.60694  ORF Transcript_47231/g.60694 Transcript_47231/m.60694 type:complete len:269 (-) Transcript_47231:171-977(-)
MAAKRDITSFFKPQEGALKKKPKAAEEIEETAVSISGPTSCTFIPNIPTSWRAVLAKEESKPYFRKLDAFLEKEHQKNKVIFPPKDEIFTALDMCPFADVRVVIIGQDPYHGKGQGHGLAFSVKHGIKVPPSLRNIIKEASTSVGISKPDHGNLSNWARQGVLMLNNVLTVEQAMADSHKKQGWELFTDEVVRVLNKDRENLVFMLWGKPAGLKGSSVNRSKHYVISSSHPSPLGATKTNAPFIGSDCFKKANQYLVKNGKPEIDWSM